LAELVSDSPLKRLSEVRTPQVEARLIGPLDLKPLIRRAGTGIFWNFLAAFLSQGAALVINVLIANTLGRASLGRYAMVQGTAMMVAVFAQVAMGSTATRYVAEFQQTNKDRAGAVLGLCATVSLVTGTLGGVVLLFASRPLAMIALKAPELDTMLEISSVLMFFSTINGYQVGALAALQSFRDLALATFASVVFQCALVVSLAHAYGIKGAVIGLTVSSFTRWLFHHIALRSAAQKKGITFQPLLALREVRILRQYAFPVALTGYIAIPASWLGSVCLARTPAGFSELAAYAVGLNIKTAVLFVPLVINSVSLVLFNETVGSHGLKDSLKIFWVNVGIMVIATGAAACLCKAVLGSLLALYGRQFHNAYPVVNLLLIASIFEAASYAGYVLVQSRAKMWLALFAIGLPRDGVFVALAFLLARTHGAVGLAVAYTTAWGLAAASTLVCAIWILHESRVPRAIRR
jgi:O-antigen/teichoic acid export membrane protein